MSSRSRSKRMRDLVLRPDMLLLFSCGGRSKPAGLRSNPFAPRIAAARNPCGQPPHSETIALGRKLYFSPVLSVDRTLSCATCHDPETGFADPRRVSTGVHGKKGTRNAPTILNAAFNKTTVLGWSRG